MTLVTTGSDEVIHQITQQLLKLVDVVKTADMTLDDHIEREMLLIKARVDPRVDCHLPDVIESAGARVLDDSPETYTIEVTGSSEQVDDFIRDVADCGTIVAVVRSGAMAVARGHNVLGGG